MDRYEIAKRISLTEYLVEADYDHVRHLWEKWSVDAFQEGYRDPCRDIYNPPRFSWKQVSPGVIRQVGTLAGSPVAVSFDWVRIGGALICFYQCTSVVADHDMVKAYLVKEFEGCPRTNVSNMGQILDVLKKPRKEVPAEADKLGFGQEALEDFQKDGIVTTRLLFDLMSFSDSLEPSVAAQIKDAVGSIKAAVSEFGKTVWQGGLQEHYRAQPHRWLETQVGDVKLYVTSLAGRVSLQLERPGWGEEGMLIHILAPETGTQGVGIQGIRAPYKEVLELIQEATQMGPQFKGTLRNTQPSLEEELTLVERVQSQT